MFFFHTDYFVLSFLGGDFSITDTHARVNIYINAEPYAMSPLYDSFYLFYKFF